MSRVGGGMQVSSAQKTILVVEDDPDVRDYASHVLEEYGYTVVSAADGTTALAMLHDEGARIDLLFIDIVMPGLDGIEVARRAVEHIPGLKVLFASGASPGFGPISRLLKKPYRARELANEIAAVLRE
jgi:two-component system, cell cycle response regulator CpdR